jgi:hypothetical protein
MKENFGLARLLTGLCTSRPLKTGLEKTYSWIKQQVDKSSA